MATSGTVGQTVIDTAKVVEHAWRRCKLRPSTQTPEMVQAALESLHVLLNYLSTRGLNLWAVEKQYIQLETGKKTYVLPSGSLSVLNVLYHRPTTVTGTVTSSSQTYQDALDSEETVVRFSLALDATPNGSVTVDSSADGVTWTNLQTFTTSNYPTTETWYDVDPQAVGSYFRVVDNGGTPSLSVSSFVLSTGGSEIVVTQFNRDEYAQQPDKDFQSGSVTNYFFEKLVNPQVTCWPVPNSGDNLLVVWLHRQIQDVGSLSQQLAVPSRWLETIINHLAYRIGLENPDVDDARVMLLKGIAEETTVGTELDETDNAPIMWQPNIGVYTR